VLGDAIAGLQPDILVSFAYGRIFPPWFLGIFPQGGVNIHPSLLPRYRGPTPLQAAILAEDRETGITIQTLASAMDAGDILFQEPFPLTGEETTGELSALMGRKAADLLPLLLQGFAQGTLTGRPQDEEKATYCSLITKGDGRIDWTLSAHRIAAQIRAFTPWPLCWTMHEGQYLYILEGKPLCPGVEAAKPAAPGAVLGIDKHTGVLIQTGEGVLGVSRLQYGTKKALDWRVFLNGARNFLDSSLG
jgi:methionyl-tRNA formyltransferase